MRNGGESRFPASSGTALPGVPRYQNMFIFFSMVNIYLWFSLSLPSFLSFLKSLCLYYLLHQILVAKSSDVTRGLSSCGAQA